jgi:hypothetical protein
MTKKRVHGALKKSEKTGRRSASGKAVLPEWEQRLKAPDIRGEVERTVLQCWARYNVRKPWLNQGHVPIDSLCPSVKTAAGKKVFDDNTLRAVNSTIQYLFGTNVGRSIARDLMAVEDQVFRAREERGKKAQK